MKSVCVQKFTPGSIEFNDQRNRETRLFCTRPSHDGCGVHTARNPILRSVTIPLDVIDVNSQYGHDAIRLSRDTFNMLTHFKPHLIVVTMYSYFSS
jgi:hypothetical protein